MASIPPDNQPQNQPAQANVAAVALALEDGTDLADKVNPRLVSLTITESREEKADQLDIVLHNTDGRLAPVQEGQIITLKLGWLKGSEVRPGLVDKGRFKVDEVEESGPPDVVTIRARSADLTGKYRKRRDKGHRNTTLGAVIRKIAAANGLTAKIHASLAGKPIPYAEQAGKSDMAFVTDLGRRFDAVATVKDKTLIFAPAAKGESGSGKALAALTLTKKDGWTWRFTTEKRGDHDGAEAQYHDRAAARTRTAKTGGGSNPRRLKRTFASEAEAQQAAESAHARDKRGKHSFSYDLAFGDASIEPERPATLSGWNSRIDGIKWTVKEATHTFDANGLQTRVALESKG